MFSLNEGLQLTVWSKKKSTLYCVINSMFLFIFIVFFDCRCCYHHDNDDFTTHVLLLKHFWPWLNNVLHQNEGLHNDGDQKKRNEEPVIVKMSRRTPASPRDGTSLCWPLTTTAPKKNGGKNVRNYSFSGILNHCIGYIQRTKIVDHSGIFDTPFIGKNHTFCIAKQRQFVVGAINSGVNLDVSLLQLLDRVNNGLH